MKTRTWPKVTITLTGSEGMDEAAFLNIVTKWTERIRRTEPDLGKIEIGAVTSHVRKRLTFRDSHGELITESE